MKSEKCGITKCGIVGCGFVGASCAFALIESGLFTEIALIDSNRAKAEGEAADLSHGLPFISPAEIYAGDYSDLSGAGLVIITAGAGQKKGETRLDLASKNAAIFKDIIPKIAKYAPDSILLVVSNPVDVLTQAALKYSGFPNARVIGSGTVLDSARLKYLLGRHLSVDPRSVHAFIIGEHGDSELAVWSSANVSGIPMSEFCELRGFDNHRENQKKLHDEVKNSAYDIIEKKGATYYGIAFSVRRIAECIARNEHSILPVSNYVQNIRDSGGLCISVPTIVGAAGAEEQLKIGLDDEEHKALVLSASALYKVIKDLGLTL